jgi:hypothetical protein
LGTPRTRVSLNDSTLNRVAWRKGNERQGFVDKLRTMNKGDLVVIDNKDNGVVVETIEQTLTVRVRTATSRHTLPYHVKAIEKT